MPACSLGRLVVCLLTWQNAWNVHLWTLVRGHSSATAEANPLPPSVTTMSGGAIRDSRDRHARLVSARARCHDSTNSSLQAIRTTQSRAIHMPSTNTTRWTSSTTSGIGHMPQNPAVRRLNVRPPPGMSAWVPLESSHETNAARAFASLSWPWVADAPHERHRQRCEPARVLPLRFIGSPQDGHLLLFTADLPDKEFFTVIFLVSPGLTLSTRHTFCPGGKIAVDHFFTKEMGADLHQLPYLDTLFVL